MLVPYDNTAEPYQWSVQSPRPQKDVEWATSSIRTWLNGEFLNAAFSADEQGAIAATTLTDTKNNVSHTAATAADPSVHAAEEHDRPGLPAEPGRGEAVLRQQRGSRGPSHRLRREPGRVRGRGEPTTSQPDGAAAWWLRSNGYYAGYASVVTDDGYVHGDGYRMAGELHDGFDDHGSELKSDARRQRGRASRHLGGTSALDGAVRLSTPIPSIDSDLD